jgi:hypothetical protein
MPYLAYLADQQQLQEEKAQNPEGGIRLRRRHDRCLPFGWAWSSTHTLCERMFSPAGGVDVLREFFAQLS